MSFADLSGGNIALLGYRGGITLTAAFWQLAGGAAMNARKADPDALKRYVRDLYSQAVPEEPNVEDLDVGGKGGSLLIPMQLTYRRNERADERTRTADLLITSELSYVYGRFSTFQKPLT
jgi:hypothetical protein